MVVCLWIEVCAVAVGKFSSAISAGILPAAFGGNLTPTLSGKLLPQRSLCRHHPNLFKDITSENSSSSKKRKIGRLLSPEELHPFVDRAYASVLEVAASDSKVERALSILKEALDNAQNINTVLTFISLDLFKYIAFNRL